MYYDLLMDNYSRPDTLKQRGGGGGSQGVRLTSVSRASPALMHGLRQLVKT